MELEEDGSPSTKATWETVDGPYGSIYLITFSRNRTIRRLHLRDGCFHARCLAEHGELRSSRFVRPGDLDAACFRCWPEGRLPSDSSPDGSTSSDSKDSSCIG